MVLCKAVKSFLKRRPTWTSFHVSVLSLIPKSPKILFKKSREKITLYDSYFQNIENGDTGFKMG